MSLKKWFFLFWTTLAIGAATGLIMGLYLQLTDQQYHFPGAFYTSYNLAGMLIAGVMFSIVTQMGFFAYLTIRYIALGILRSNVLWDIVQVLLVAVTLFDAVYLRYISYAQAGQSWLDYVLLPFTVLTAGAVIALCKVKLTNSHAFISTLFFVTAATLIEALPALRINTGAAISFMIVPLICCNGWQILILHKLLRKAKKPETGSQAVAHDT